MSVASKALLVVNRRSSRSDSDLDEGLAVLRASGIDVVVETIDDPEAMPQRVRDDATADIIIIGGGDGSLNAAVDAVLATGRPMGILPMGNANDLARTLGIPTSLPEACRVIATGQLRRIDLGRVNGKHFFNVASIGMSTKIAKKLHPEIKRRWGLLSYPIIALNAIKRFRSFKISVTANESTETFASVQVAIGNGRYYGGGMTIVDDAAIDDGRLDFYSINPLPVWKLLLLVPVFRWGKHRAVDDVRLLYGTEFIVETRRPMPINVDGEVLTRTPAKFEVIPKVLEVFVPKRSEINAAGIRDSIASR